MKSTFEYVFTVGNGVSSSLETGLDFDNMLKYVGDWNTYQYGMLVGLLNSAITIYSNNKKIIQLQIEINFARIIFLVTLCILCA